MESPHVPTLLELQGRAGYRSTRALARTADVAPSCLNGYVAGTGVGRPCPWFARRLARALGVEPSAVYGAVDESKRQYIAREAARSARRVKAAWRREMGFYFPQGADEE